MLLCYSLTKIPVGGSSGSLATGLHLQELVDLHLKHRGVMKTCTSDLQTGHDQPGLAAASLRAADAGCRLRSGT